MSILAIAFQDDLKAHQTARVLAEWQAKGRAELTCAAIINRAPSGKLVVRQIGRRHLEATGAAAPIGIFAGVPAGPLTALIGAICGAAVGATADSPGAGEALKATQAELASFVAGMTVIVADVATADEAALTALCEGAGGKVLVL